MATIRKLATVWPENGNKSFKYRVELKKMTMMAVPTRAPTLLPLPPTMTMPQMIKVIRGMKSIGDM